jgi:hypothetical protein
MKFNIKINYLRKINKDKIKICIEDQKKYVLFNTNFINDYTIYSNYYFRKMEELQNLENN